jgi:fructose-1,6-bisphosphatase I
VNGGEVCGILSEEEDDIIQTGNNNAKYVVAMGHSMVRQTLT